MKKCPAFLFFWLTDEEKRQTQAFYFIVESAFHRLLRGNEQVKYYRSFSLEGGFLLIKFSPTPLPIIRQAPMKKLSSMES